MTLSRPSLGAVFTENQRAASSGGGDAIERRDVLPGQRHSPAAQQGTKLLGVFDANRGGGDTRLHQHPGERDPTGRRVELGRNVVERLKNSCTSPTDVPHCSVEHDTRRNAVARAIATSQETLREREAADGTTTAGDRRRQQL